MNQDLKSIVEKYGVERTFSYLRALTENLVLKLEDYELPSPEGQLEAELICMSFYMYYLTSINESAQGKMFAHHLLDFYAGYMEGYFTKGELAIFNQKNPKRKLFIYDKLSSYYREMLNCSIDPSYKSKYIFAALYMYPFMSDESVRETCSLVSGQNADDFVSHIRLLSDSLWDICNNLSKYVVVK